MNRTIPRAAVALLVAATAMPLCTVIGANAGARSDPVRASTPARSKLETIVDRLQRHYESTRSFKARFVEQLSGMGGPTRTRGGTVYYEKGGKMRWEFEPPMPATIVSDGTTLYDYEKDLNQVVKVPVDKAFKTNAVAFLMGLGDVRHQFNAALPSASPDDGLVYVDLIPKKDGEKIELGLDPKSYNIVKFKLTNDLGGVTELKFSDMRTNVALNSSLFKFEVPDGVDVVSPQS